jgi:hypothetical protein
VSSLIEKTKLPRSERGVSSVENEVVSFFPDLLSTNDEDFHEKINVK